MDKKFVLRSGNTDGGSIALIHVGSGVSDHIDGLVTISAAWRAEVFLIDSIKNVRREYKYGDLRVA